MLDQMSRGRLMVGVGKGISPIEIGYYGVDFKNADKMFAEAIAVILQALTQKSVDFEGEFFRFKNVPMELSPFQQPHPPLWYGVIKPDSAERAAKTGMNFVSNSTRRSCSGHARRPLPRGVAGRAARRLHAEARAEPLHGARRHRGRGAGDRPARLWSLVDELHDAVEQARHRSRTRSAYPAEIDGQIADSRAIVGTPDKALELLRGQIAESGTNYLVCRFAFGDMSLPESLRSLELFQRHVMPALRESVAVAAE